jgi:7-cyano-7-deazaguanine synthase in queuosine biosynthesis
LDSFAQSQLLKLDGSSATPIRLTAWNRSLAGNRDWILEADGTRHRRVSVPIKVAANTHAEQTFRTRSFIFCVLAGLASYLAEAESVIIPEAGQGSLGPSIVPLGAESPHRGSHPGFTRRMAEFFAAFWKKEIRILHPQLWRTKGEVLALLKTNRLLNGWDATRSCSRDQRVIRTERHVLLQCGICSGCLLRRLSVTAAALSEPADGYLWSDLGAKSLDEALCADARRNTTANDYDIAVHSVLAMEELARKAGQPAEDPALQSTIFDAYGNNSSERANGMIQLTRLLSAHGSEWATFTRKFASASWLNQQIALI